MHLAAIAGFFPLAQSAGYELAAAFVRFAHAAAPVAIAALWQGAVVALGLAICLRLAPRLSAAHRFSLWAGGFVVLLGLQALPLFFHLAAAQGTESPINPSGLPAHPWFQVEFDVRWALAIAALWLVFALARAVDLALHTLRLRKLWKSASPVDGISTAGASGRRRVAVCTTAELDRPSVIGFFWPRILIPDWLYTRLTPGELEQVVLHECEHLRRRDDWTNLLQKLALVLFPLNPALAWIEHRLCREREMACDEAVVRVTCAPRAYAACLASMAERRLEQSLARRAAAALSLGAFERRSELVRRVHSILRRRSVLSPLGSRALVGVVGCGLLVGAVELARSPQVVAFVSAPAAGAQAAQLLPATNSPEDLGRFDGRSAQAFRAVNAMAIMPAAPQRIMPSSAARNGAVTSEAFAGATAILKANRWGLASTGPASNGLRPPLTKAEMREAETTDAARTGLAQASALPQQWIVLTTWEQVEVPAAGAGTTADFGADSAAAALAQPGKSNARQITVTQLILRVYPANAVPARGAKAQAAGANSTRPNPVFNSVLHRQAVVPLSSGWLVIRL